MSPTASASLGKYSIGVMACLPHQPERDINILERSEQRLAQTSVSQSVNWVNNLPPGTVRLSVHKWKHSECFEAKMEITALQPLSKNHIVPTQQFYFICLLGILIDKY